MPELRSTGDLTVVQGNELPPPVVSDFRPERPDIYRLGPLDKLRVDVFGVTELQNMEFQLDAAGRLTFPFVGPISASGMSIDELSAAIADGLRGRYVLDPKVAVNLTQQQSQLVTVEGSVVEPGVFPVTSNTTLLRAIAQAKGLSEFAKVEQIVILRTVDSQRMAALYDLRQIRSGVYADPAIYANDVIVVGDSPQRRMFRDFLQLTPLLTAPLIAVLQNNN